jgi:type IV pilus assembly protein PilC
MATRAFEYAVRDRQGKIIKGRVEASSQAAVANRLREMGLATVSINEVRTGGLNSEVSFGSKDKVDAKDLAIMARQLATMVDSGLSLLRALAILAEQTESKNLARIIADVRTDVETGSSLSQALGRHPRTFPPLMISMVRAGEIGGFLDRTLLSIADNLENEVRLRGKVKSAMMYPVVVLCIAIVAVIAMLLFIVPVFQNMFTSLGGSLPWPTLILVWLSKALKWGIGPLVAAVVLFAAWWRRHKNDRAIREKLDPLKLRAPVFGKLTQKIAISRFSRNLGAMVHAGVPLLQALEIVGAASGNVVVERATTAVQESVRRGQSLSAPLSQHPVFPPMVVQMMAVGEDTGALDTMLDKVADFYDQEVEATTEALTSIIEPLMIAFVGGIVGSMVIALYLPMFSIFNLIQ